METGIPYKLSSFEHDLSMGNISHEIQKYTSYSFVSSSYSINDIYFGSDTFLKSLAGISSLRVMVPYLEFISLYGK